MKIKRRPVYYAVFSLLLATCGQSYCSTVTFDVTAKTALSDDPKIEAKWAKVKGGQAGIYIQNLTDEPQTVTLKFAGLKDGNYDMYLNWGEFAIQRRRELQQMDPRAPKEDVDPGSVVRGLSSSELAAGRRIELSGLVVPQSLARCARSIAPRLRALYKQLQGERSGQPGTAADTVSQATSWVDNIVSAEEAYRAAQVFVTPANAAPKAMEWRARLLAGNTVSIAKEGCLLLQRARAAMSKQLKDPLLRDTVLEALTPVDVSVKYTQPKGIPTVNVVITNNCDLSISGTAGVVLPAGWKAVAKKPSFSKLASGAVYKETFTLKRTAKGAPVPGKVTVRSTIKVASPEGTAVLNITRYAEGSRL